MSTKSSKSNKKVGFVEDDKPCKSRESRSRFRSRSGRERRSKSEVAVSNKENIPKKREHSLVSMVRNGGRNSVRNLVRLFESKTMNEGRKSQIVLPDERRLDLLIQPKLYTRDLLDLVSSHFKLKEKEYFGINFTDETGHSNWLNLDKKVLEHDLPRKTGILILNFSVRFYAESFSSLRDTATVELFYLNAKQLIFRSQIECDSDTIFELAAYVLQALFGDYVDEESVRAELKKLPLVPTSALREHPSISYCEDKVIAHYKKLISISKGLSIVNYMSIVESLPTYGIHYYEVKDKKDIPWWLGLSYKGIAVYDKTDKKEPRKIFTWKLLENLYYRDKKFSIEVHDPKRVIQTLSGFNLYEDAIREPVDEGDELSDAIVDPSTQVSVSRRTFGPGNVAVHAWFGSTAQLTKCIWSMAVAQHQFYLDRKHSKSILHFVRSSSEIAAELSCSRSSSSLPGSFDSDISHSASSSSLPNLSGSRFDINLDHLDAIKAQREMFEALKARKEALDEKLRKKTGELRLLCLQEGELTGKLPREFPLAPGEQPPAVRRRVGTSFSLASKVQDDKAEDTISKLELEYELQKQITQAADRLSQDKSVSKYVRKQRRQSFHRAEKKLREMEKKLSEGKGGDPALPSSLDAKFKTSGMTRNQSFFLLQMEDSDDPHSQKSSRESPSRQVHQPMQRSATVRELSPTENRPPLSPTLSSPSLFGNFGGTSQPRDQLYTPLANRSHSSGSNMSNQSEYENVHNYKDYTGSQDSGFSSANNMYNLTTQQKSHYESSDQLKTPTNKNCSENVFDDKHSSLDSSYRKSSNPKNYGSLERNMRRKNELSWQPRDRQHSDSDASVNQLTDIEPSKYGSKRASQSEYDLSGLRNNLIELPVRHEEQEERENRRHQNRWNDVAHTEPSPVIQSPNQEHREEPQCYSPRNFEGNFQNRKGGRNSPYVERSVLTKRVESPNSSAVVTVTKLQPHRNVELVSKPFEMSDFYKYSEKIRRQRLLDNYQQQLLGDSLSRCSSPSQHSTDSGDGSTGYSSVQKYPHPNYSPSHSSSSSGHSHYRMAPSNHSTPVRTQSPYLSRKGDYDSSSQNASTPKYQTQSTHVQYSVQTASGGRVIKSVHTTTKHTQYQPLTPLKCDPIHNQTTTPSSRGYNPTNR